MMLAWNIKPKIIGLIVDGKSEKGTGLIIILDNLFLTLFLTLFLDGEAIFNAKVLFYHVTFYNIKIFCADVGGKLFVKIQKTKHTINKIGNHKLTTGVFSI